MVFVIFSFLSYSCPSLFGLVVFPWVRTLTEMSNSSFSAPIIIDGEDVGWENSLSNVPFQDNSLALAIR